MKTTFLILLTAILLAGCSPKSAQQKPDQSANQTQQQSHNKNQNQTQNQISGSFQDLMNMGKSLHCTWQYQDQNGSGNGEVYVSGNKFRSKVKVQTSQGQVTSNSISDGNWMYQWSDVTPQGFKFNLQELQDLDPEISDPPDHAQGAYQTLNQNYSYDCESWTVDNSQFQVPSDVNFTDFSQTIKQVQEFTSPNQGGQIQNVQQDACSMCDLLPDGDPKTQCLKNCQ